MNTQQLQEFRTLGEETIRDLETDNGILASSNKELFGFVFGRDSAITALILLSADARAGTSEFQSVARRVLVGLGRLQGKETNIESGEEPGKIIHDYRESGHELLTEELAHPWYVYPDGVMRSFDSVDSTPLYLMLASRYIVQYGDRAILEEIGGTVRAALEWLLEYADNNGDGLIDYRIHPERKSGGLYVQNWMDHEPTLFHEDGSEVAMPVAPLEVQAYTYAAFRDWAEQYSESDDVFAKTLNTRADQLKKLFNEYYIFEDAKGTFLASAIDGSGKPLLSPRSSMGHVLWAVHTSKDGVRDGILNENLVAKVIARLMEPDLFLPEAGVRTLSSESAGYAPDGYHNGAVWPHDTYLVAEGLRVSGDEAAANKMLTALFTAYAHFKTPLELFVFDDGYKEFRPDFRDPACKYQAWSAAAMVAGASLLLQGDR